MRRLIIWLLALVPVAAGAEEGGCIKYGAGSAVGQANQHTLSGAATGCGINADKSRRARERDRSMGRAYQQGLEINPPH